MDSNCLQTFSLLWPYSIDINMPESDTPKRYLTDLGLQRIVDEINTDPRLRPKIEQIIYNLNTDPDVINYRLDIITDLLNNPKLQSGLKSLIPLIQKLARYLDSRNSKGLHNFQVAAARPEKLGAYYFQAIAWRLEILSLYHDIVVRLHQVLSDSRLASAGLLKLADELNILMSSAAFRDLAQDLPEMKAAVASVSSVTIGINLNASLRPSEVVLLSVGTRQYKQKSFLTRILGVPGEDEGLKGYDTCNNIYRNKPPQSPIGRVYV